MQMDHMHARRCTCAHYMRIDDSRARLCFVLALGFLYIFMCICRNGRKYCTLSLFCLSNEYTSTDTPHQRSLINTLWTCDTMSQRRTPNDDQLWNDFWPNPWTFRTRSLLSHTCGAFVPSPTAVNRNRHANTHRMDDARCSIKQKVRPDAKH